MFLANDPWVGAAHQQDVMLICPVFWKGELFCWVTNCLHQYDLGGITPSSFCGSAENAFEEAICIPPVKIVEGNEIRRDIEELYLRASRKPEAVALDFRAQLAGNITARDRVLALIGRYGPEVVKGVMRWTTGEQLGTTTASPHRIGCIADPRLAVRVDHRSPAAPCLSVAGRYQRGSGRRADGTRHRRCNERHRSL